MQVLVTITASELDADPSARLWAFAIYLAEHPEVQLRPEFRPFWLAYSYDAQVMNGGHLQYFYNCGTGNVTETLVALHTIGAHNHAALLADCWSQVKRNPVSRVASLEQYSSLAAERSFSVEDTKYYKEELAVLGLLEVHYASLLAESVAVSA
jgi:hypothetical protein